MKQHKMSKAEYFNLVNNSTYMSNINKGNVIDPTRYRLDQKQKQFKKLKADDPNFIAEQTSPQSNYARLK
tara:strand:- start:400 stop:609 length:210 start_codon:yes stop_codon:yes gene_type:complete